MSRLDACDACLRRTALIVALSGRLDVEWRRRAVAARVLALPDDALLALAPAAARRGYERFDPVAARAAAGRAALALACRCGASYPDRLRELPDPPAVLHVLGRFEALRDADADAVAIVGARRATEYGLGVSRALGRGLSAAGVPVVSGMALGIDAAAHYGVLAGRAAPVAVLAAAPETAYPARHRGLHEAIAARGCVLSELPPGAAAYRWSFVARNRIVAALAQVAVIVEATEQSGSLTTADFAADLGRTVAAVPGRVTTRTAAGTNALLQSGAALVRNAADVLELLAEATGRAHAPAPSSSAAAPVDVAPSPGSSWPDLAPSPNPPPDLAPPLLALLTAVEDGRGTLGALAGSSQEAKQVLAGLGELEFRGLVRRTFGGRYERVA